MFIINYLKNLFRPTVDGIMSDINKTVDKLETLSENQARKASRIATKIDELYVVKSTASKESVKAMRMVNSIKTTFGLED